MLIDLIWFTGLITGALFVTTLTPLILMILLIKDWLGGNLW